MGNNDEREQTLNQLLVEMDGLDTSKGVIIRAATNAPEVLDAALVRRGRFDRQVLIDRPDLIGREEILKLHAGTVKLSPSVDLSTIAASPKTFHRLKYPGDGLFTRFGEVNRKQDVLKLRWHRQVSFKRHPADR